MSDKKIIIIGAGPTGIGAAYRLHELGYSDWEIFERNDYIGGLSTSFKDDLGFVWDVGGHIIFSHYEYFDSALEKVLGDEYLQHQRRAFIWCFRRWVPYPFQNNIRHLPSGKMLRCVAGLIKAKKNRGEPTDFDDWIGRHFGKGIADYFMRPQNFKTWAHPLDSMSYDWIAERVSVIDVKKVLKNILLGADDAGWGPNNTFRFPLYGGTGEIFRRFMPYMKDRLSLGKELVKIDSEKKEVAFSDKDTRVYDVLINTMPLDKFVRCGDFDNVIQFTDNLKHNSVFVVGIGLRKENKSEKCWMYFPEDAFPFYRVTNFSHYSPNNVPGEGYSSLMCEVAASSHKSVQKEDVVEDVIAGLIKAGLIAEKDRNLIVSKNLIEASYAYPVPTLNRNEALDILLPYLRNKDILSCGRFGAWRYEEGNMDHCFMQGVNAVNDMLGTV